MTMRHKTIIDKYLCLSDVFVDGVNGPGPQGRWAAQHLALVFPGVDVHAVDLGTATLLEKRRELVAMLLADMIDEAPQAGNDAAMALIAKATSSPPDDERLTRPATENDLRQVPLPTDAELHRALAKGARHRAIAQGLPPLDDLATSEIGSTLLADVFPLIAFLREHYPHRVGNPSTANVVRVAIELLTPGDGSPEAWARCRAACGLLGPEAQRARVEETLRELSATPPGDDAEARGEAP